MIKLLKTQQDISKETIEVPKIMDWEGDKIIVLGKNGDDGYYVFNISQNSFLTAFNLPGAIPPTDFNEPLTIQNS